MARRRQDVSRGEPPRRVLRGLRGQLEALHAGVRGTQAWIAECNRWLDLCVARARKGDEAEAREDFRMIFELLRRIDEGDEAVVFFADEGGSWKVGVEWEKVLPAWFRCLGATAVPEEYAREAVRAIEDSAPYDRERFLRETRAAASSE